MKHSFIFLLFISLNSVAQITYVDGYFIDNSNKRIPCQIKNEDWLRNPTFLKYRFSATEDPLTVKISEIKEFQVANSKYIRVDVKMDTSSQVARTLTYSRTPQWSNKKVLLKVLVEGKANLYVFDRKDLVLFFFKVDSSSIEQLEYKTYLAKDDRITVIKNLTYINQLKTQVSCGQEFSKVAQDRMRYDKEFLTNYFIRYNKCSGVDAVTFKSGRKNNFRLKVTPGIDFSAAKIQASGDPKEKFPSREVSMRIGFEAELILPFNVNKWSIFLEPTYQSYESKGPTRPITYRSIEIPLGVRHYFHLSKNSRLFINAAGVFDFPIEYSAQLSKNFKLTSNFLKINFAGGVGFNYKRMSIEGRYYSLRTGLDTSNTFNFDFVKSSVILGYRIF